MLTSDKRKSIAKSFIWEFFGARPELWKNYKAKDEKGLPKSWCPFPIAPWIRSNNEDPIIGVGETFDEAKEIAKAELSEERFGYAEFEEYEYVDGKKYWIVYD